MWLSSQQYRRFPSKSLNAFIKISCVSGPSNLSIMCSLHPLPSDKLINGKSGGRCERVVLRPLCTLSRQLVAASAAAGGTRSLSRQECATPGAGPRDVIGVVTIPGVGVVSTSSSGYPGVLRDGALTLGTDYFMGRVLCWAERRAVHPEMAGDTGSTHTVS